MKLRALFLLVSVTLLRSQSAPGTQEQSLREAADRVGMLVGTAVRPAQLSEKAYASTLAREFNLLEPEDALKWEVIHPTRDSFDFSQADRIVDFATLHGMKVRGHTLVWHRQNPQWLIDGGFKPGELAEILERHIKTVIGHYRGKVFAWDVVNEAFDESHPGKLRSTIWRDQPGIGPGNGTGYIEHCFRWAHEADPLALLFYNDAEAEEINPKSDAIYAMVQDFRKRGVPIDGVGFQVHIANLHADIASISANMKRFTALGIQVQITEMDVALPVDSNGNAQIADLKTQANLYREITAACLSYRWMHGHPDLGFH